MTDPSNRGKSFTSDVSHREIRVIANSQLMQTSPTNVGTADDLAGTIPDALSGCHFSFATTVTVLHAALRNSSDHLRPAAIQTTSRGSNG